MISREVVDVLSCIVSNCFFLIRQQSKFRVETVYPVGRRRLAIIVGNVGGKVTKPVLGLGSSKNRLDVTEQHEELKLK